MEKAETCRVQPFGLNSFVDIQSIQGSNCCSAMAWHLTALSAKLLTLSYNHGQVLRVYVFLFFVFTLHFFFPVRIYSPLSQFLFSFLKTETNRIQECESHETAAHQKRVNKNSKQESIHRGSSAVSRPHPQARLLTILFRPIFHLTSADTLSWLIIVDESSGHEA